MTSSNKVDASAAVDMAKVIPLVTGGGSGIGLGLVKEFLKYGSPKVLITGRREAVLQQVAEEEEFKGKVFYKVSDAGKAKDFEELFEWVKQEHPDVNTLVNNAGIMRPLPPVADKATWEERVSEIDINLSGPIHLCTLFIPFFLSKESTTCTLVNITSGLAYVPFASAPVYSATKAAIRSYTMAMRHSLEGTNIRMVEIVPPAVLTELGVACTGEKFPFGEPLDEFCDAVMKPFVAGGSEIGYKFSEMARKADREKLDATCKEMAADMHVPTFAKHE